VATTRSHSRETTAALNLQGDEVTNLIERLEQALKASDEIGAPEVFCTRETARAILSALRGEEWQVIETAPKDGREINGYRPDQGVFTFRWAWAEEFVPKDQNGDPTEDYDENFAWWWHDVWGWMEGEETPTHWRPLPPPPKGTSHA
jgi:hypothetical protein